MTIIARVLEKNFDIGLALNGILGGLVSITANCSVVNHWAAILIGMVGAFVCYGASRLMLRLRIDDPLDAFAVHGYTRTHTRRTRTQTHTRTHTNAHAHTRTHTRTHTHTHTIALFLSLSHTRTHTRTYIHIQTRTLAFSLSDIYMHTHAGAAACGVCLPRAFFAQIRTWRMLPTPILRRTFALVFIRLYTYIYIHLNIFSYIRLQTHVCMHISPLPRI